MYNFEVAGDHDYYVSTAQLLVHNCDGISGSGAGESAGEGAGEVAAQGARSSAAPAGKKTASVAGSRL